MTTRIDVDHAMELSSELLCLSRQIRSLRFSVEEIQKNLRSITELDNCKYELKKQEEDIALLTARVVNMSTGLSEVAELYKKAERRNADLFENEGAPIYDYQAAGSLYESDGLLRERLDRILYQK